MFSYCVINVINSNRGGSYIDSLDWIKNKKTTINPANKKIIAVALNHEEIRKNLERITKININKYKWEGINFPSEKDDWKKIEKNNVTIALNVLYTKKEKIYPAYISKINSNREKQVILLMIPNGQRRWHYLVVKKLSVLLREITSKHHVDFYCLICFHSFATENKCESHKKLCENKDFRKIVMPSEDNKILEFNQYQKSDKAPFVIYADLEMFNRK